MESNAQRSKTQTLVLHLHFGGHAAVVNGRHTSELPPPILGFIGKMQTADSPSAEPRARTGSASDGVNKTDGLLAEGVGEYMSASATSRRAP